MADERSMNRPAPRRPRPAPTRLLLTALCGLCISVGAPAQPAPSPRPSPPAALSSGDAPTPAELPALSPALERLLKAPYLSDEELKDLRIFHGVWRESDLDTPARAARAALIRGDYLDPSFDADDVNPLDRAEARLAAGRPTDAIREIEHAGPAADSARASMLRARAAEVLGRFDDAVTVIDQALARGPAAMATPEDVVCGVRMLAQRIHLRGTDDKAALTARSGDPAGELKADPQAYHQMVETLGRLRLDTGNGLFWPALLAEAEILCAHDKPADTQAALGKLLELNPACADAWAMLGRMSVDAFNFDATESIAMRLDALAGNPAPRAGDQDDSPEAPPVADSSIDAAIIRARAEIRQIDGADAVRVLDPLLARFPTHPGLLAVRAAAEATRFEFDALASRLADYDKLYPGTGAALAQAGRALSESRQYAKSEEMLKAAAARLPTDSDVLGDLGLMYVQWGKNDLALDALERAYALDPFNLRVDNSLRLVRELLTYSEVHSEHFTVRYKPGVDEVFARDILAPMEENHRLVTGSGPGGVDHQPFADSGGGKTVIDLMPDHEWFGVRIAGMPAIHTIAASTGPLIAMEAPREGPKNNGPYDWKRVLRHEYTHTVNLDRTHNRIPHWYTEANAVYMELSPREYNTCRLLCDAFEADELFDFAEINIAFVRPKKPSDRAQGYAQGHLMYEYIITRWGARAPLDLMDQYARGVREEQAFNTVLGITRAQFLDDFKPWTREQLVKWGMLPPQGMPTVKQLVEAASAEHKPQPAIPDAPPAPQPGPGDDQPAVAAQADPAADPALIRQWLDQYPAHPDLLELALDAELVKSGGKATPDLLPLIDRYAAARPVDPKPHRLLAQMRLASDDASERFKAIEHLEYLDAREQKTTAYATELARLYFARGADGDLPRAQAKAERATQIAPYEAPPRELAATIAIKARDFDSAERHIVALTRLEPDRDIHQQRLAALQKLRATEAR